MKKYFLYELKKHLWTLVILLAVFALPNVITMGSSALYWEYYPEGYGGITEKQIYNPPWDWAFWGMLLSLFIVPTIVYSFKMTKRGVDGYYSLPLKKEKLYFVATMVGLILVLVPFTVGYWGGFLALLARPENPYDMSYFLPTYFGGVCFGIFLYGVNAFLFTRANRTSDGVIFMLVYAFIGTLVYEYFHLLFRGYDVRLNYSAQSTFQFGGGLIEFVQEMGNVIARGRGKFGYAGLWFGTSIAAGILCYILLFYLLRLEKGENAEQNSDSWFGYKTLIPIYLAFGMGLGGDDLMSMIVMLVAAVVATIVHKRTFRLKLKDLLPLAIGFVVGILLMVIAG